MSKKSTPPAFSVPQPGPTKRPFLLYAGDDEKVHVRVLVHGETLWLPLAQIAELFEVQTPGISKHLKNIFESGELDREATVSKMETVQSEGGRKLRHYNLDAGAGAGEEMKATGSELDRMHAKNEKCMAGFGI